MSQPIHVAYGGGVDSTGMLVAMLLRHIWPTAITFADTRSEGPWVLEYVVNFSAWLIEHIDVKALLPAGPNAQRTAVSFFQDGDYQERLFRGVEKKFPKICHLGNWHSHHCNGLRTLSRGDCETYRRNVNSPNHAQDFFYALLVTHGTPNEQLRYGVKHFVFVRHSPDFIEVPMNAVSISGEILAL